MAMTTTTVSRARDAVGVDATPGGPPRAGGRGLQRRDRRRAAARARRRLPAPRAGRRPGPARAGRPPWRSSSGSARSAPSRACGPAARAASRSSSARSRSSTAPCTSSTSPPERRRSDLTGVLALAAGRRAGRPGRRDPVAPPRRGHGRPPPALGLPRRRRPRRAPRSRFFTVVPIGMAITETHKFREPIGAPPSADYREVAFDATDGVHLSGWYRPTRNGATILVVHGGGGDRTGAVAPRQAARPPRLRRAAVRRPRPRAAARARRTPSAGAGPRTSPGRCAS